MGEDRSMTRRSLLRILGITGGAAMAHLAGLGAATSLAQAPLKLGQQTGRGQKVAILGGGVGGLIAAYELLKAGYRCTVIEANPKVGGRSLTLRHGDVLTETLPDGQRYLDTGETSSEQVCRFAPAGARRWKRPYLNAGPGRLSSAHIHILNYCKELNVPLEVYVMESRSNLVRGWNERTYVNRHIAGDARGRISEELYNRVDQIPDLSTDQQNALRRLLISFGYLGAEGHPHEGRYTVETPFGPRYVRPEPRAGYDKLPGVHPGESVQPITLDELLESEFWETSFYQPESFLWQPTLFQPVGGMDRIEVRLAKAIRRHPRGKIITKAPIGSISYDSESRKWTFRTESGKRINRADVCISNIPIPLLEPLFQERPFNPEFNDALENIFALNTTGVDDGFLAPTCKVGWQANRDLWQSPNHARVVPIFGGISWTSHPMTQLWYPSGRFYDDLGVLTGAYNFAWTAEEWGNYSPEWRLREARDGAMQLAGKTFADGLHRGLSIAWQNMVYQRGGWAQWQNVCPDDEQKRVLTYNNLLKGDKSVNFFICGDQLSELPGWKEGAAVSAIHAVNRICDDRYLVPQVDRAPDSRILVEGIMPMP